MNQFARTRLSATLSLSCLAAAAIGPSSPALAAPPAAGSAPARAAAAPDDEAPEDESPPTVQDLTYKIQALETRLDQMQSLVTARRTTLALAGYVDFGFFVPQGNGSGIVRDQGNALF